MHAEPGPPGSHLQQEESSSWPSPRWWLGGRGHQGGLPTGEQGCSPPGLSPLSQGKAGFSGAFGSEPPDCRGAGSSRPLWTAFKSSRTTSPWHPRLAVGVEVGVQAPGSHCHTTGGLRASEHRVVRVAQLGKCRKLASCWPVPAQPCWCRWARKLAVGGARTRTAQEGACAAVAPRGFAVRFQEWSGLGWWRSCSCARQVADGEEGRQGWQHGHVGPCLLPVGAVRPWVQHSDPVVSWSGSALQRAQVSGVPRAQQEGLRLGERGAGPGSPRPQRSPGCEGPAWGRIAVLLRPRFHPRKPAG